MIGTGTVMILGAGASIGYGFPSGLQLKALICQEIKRKHQVYDDLVQYIGEEDIVNSFCENLLLSSEMSVDAFLEHNPEYANVGKRAVAHVLLRRESHKTLYDDWIDKWLNPHNQEQHWYQLLFSKLNSPFETFQENKLAIITFNYDRSLEYFLVQSMRAKYSGRGDATIIEKFHSIPIVHVYGKLGNMHECDSDGPYVPYDVWQKVPGKHYRKYVMLAAKSIITIHERKELGQVIDSAHELLSNAKRIYFLGFGYDRTNMERLFVKAGKNLLKEGGLGGRCLGTAKGVSPHHKQFLVDFGLTQMRRDYDEDITGLRGGVPCFPNCSIYDFLHHNPRSKLD